VPILVLSGSAPTSQADQAHFQNVGKSGSRDLVLYREGTGFGAMPATVGAMEKAWSACRERLSSYRPAHLVLPLDVQDAPAPRPSGCGPLNRRGAALTGGEIADLNRLCLAWAQAGSPLLVLGPRVSQLRAQGAVDRLVSACGAPVASTIGAHGLLSDQNPRSLGNFGFGGQPAANAAMTGTAPDHILFIGGGPGQRDGIDWAALARRPGLRISRIDTGPRQNNGPFSPGLDLHVSALETAVDHFCACLSNRKPARQTTIPEHSQPLRQGNGTLMERYLRTVQDNLPDDTILFVDAGAHRIAAARVWRSRGNGCVQSSPEQAPMGWAIAAAIGGRLARSGGCFVCLTGDGSMRMMGQEISTAARYRVPLILLVANNAGYGSVAARAPDIRHAEQFGELGRVDWVRYARIMGGAGMRVTGPGQIAGAIRSGLAFDGPFVIDLHLPSGACAQAAETGATQDMAGHDA
ncbi:MAG: thiamine pyrophosphate-dependent enzyme, partial [Rhodobacter sp.]|nr:thiamine pyrophosphate-dependent enzyme [Rhodobacter sp.]